MFEAPSVLPPRRKYDHKIPLVPGAQPVSSRPYRLPPALKDEMEKQVKEMLDAGIIRPSTSAFSSPVTTRLSVGACKGPHQWRWLQHFPGLLSLSIANCGDLTCPPDIIQLLSSLKELCLEDEDMEELPIWLGELPSLKNLTIFNSNGVKELNENMRQLTKLESLILCHIG